MKGRKPNLAVLDGGRVTGKCPSAPSWLSNHAKAEWMRSAPKLHQRNLLTADTIATLESYCCAIGQVRECEETMQAEGRVIMGKESPVPHPAHRIQIAAMREARLLATELCLTPHRQGTAGKDKGKSDDGWDTDLLG